jgi:cytoskeletal protein CcmA (bactofilin family)
MSSEKEYGASDGSRSQLGKGSSVTGDLQFPGTLELMGEVQGSVTAHSIVVAESGVVDGSLVAQTVALRGKFDGEVTCEEARLHSGAQVTGRITYRRLMIESGARVEARFVMQEKAEES